MTGTADAKIVKIMDRYYYEKIFSTERMMRYFQKYPNNDFKAISHYHLNIRISESFYPILSILEVSLRNSMNRELTRFFETEDWYLIIDSTFGLENLKKDIDTAKKHIINRKEHLTSAKVIAELTLGFWVRLLNAEYERILWKPLRKAFPYLEKQQRKRHTVSAPVNKIRHFRNRVFHHEPIAWNFEKLENTHYEILLVMSWINKDLPQIVSKFDRVNDVIQNAKNELHK